METPQRQCRKCGRHLDDTPDFFRPRPDGTANERCRDCVRQKRLKRTEREQAGRSAALNKIETNGIDRMLRVATTGGSSIPHSAEMVESIMEYFGGVRGFAAIFAKQYWECPPGGAMRSKMLECVGRMVTQNTSDGGAVKPLDLMSEDELEAEIHRRVRQQALLISRGIINGEIEEAPALPVPGGSAAFASPAPDDGRVSAEDLAVLAVRAGEQAAGSVEAVPSHGEAGGVPFVQGE